MLLKQYRSKSVLISELVPNEFAKCSTMNKELCIKVGKRNNSIL